MEGETQEVIANRLGISRVKAGSWLKRAHAEGVVDVRVLQHPSVSAEIERELIRCFGIKRVLVSLDHADADVQRSGVASLAADHLSKTLHDGSIVAVGMGCNVGAVADMMGDDFIDLHGQPARTPLQGRVIGLTIGDLARILDAIASENTKAAGILGALRTGVIDTLATSVINAHAVLRLDEATPVAETG
ncbi:sugar-binding domain-containing protein [Halomonas elongata]|uniref:sugar-binding domain-containing protein n=1 Tax=Halomonas elongata TaxID=2746 RepID=UPI0038D3F0D8